MAFRRAKLLVLLIILSFGLSNCSDFRAVFNGKPKHKVSKKRKKSGKKRRNQPAPAHAKGYFVWPLKAPISSGYGPRWGRFHDGIDIDGAMGDPIKAAAAGTVVFSDRLGGYGRLIVIRHKNGFFTAYAHNKKNLVKKGKWVRQRQIIGKVGNSGKSTGDHLHFEVRDQKGTFDPLDFLPRKRYTQKR